jgi:hypothetical protein
MPVESRVRLNQMGIAVVLCSSKALPFGKPDLHDLSEGKKYVLKQQAQVFLER